MLEKHQVVMKKDHHIVAHHDTAVRFVSETSGEMLDVPRELWEDMMRPTEITVTVEPGNKLDES